MHSRHNKSSPRIRVCITIVSRDHGDSYTCSCIENSSKNSSQNSSIACGTQLAPVCRGPSLTRIGPQGISTGARERTNEVSSKNVSTSHTIFEAWPCVMSQTSELRPLRNVELGGFEAGQCTSVTIHAVSVCKLGLNPCPRWRAVAVNASQRCAGASRSISHGISGQAHRQL